MPQWSWLEIDSTRIKNSKEEHKLKPKNDIPFSLVQIIGNILFL